MMTNEEFVDEHVNDLRDLKAPALLAKHPSAVAFMREFGSWAGTVVETAAVLGPEAEAYALRQVGQALVDWGRKPIVRPV